MTSLYDRLKNNSSFNAYLRETNLATRKTRDLEHIHLQLTPFCNLRCKMCYARMDIDRVRSLKKHILSFDEWKYYIDAAFDLGCFNITFTGGECTMHPDFLKIYSYTYDKDFDIAVMTNGTNISEDLWKLWRNKPPRGISMTLYGASAETYEKLCGNREAYYKAYENIEKILEYGFYLVLKYTAVKDNYKDVETVMLYTKDKGIPISISGLLLQFGQCDIEKIKMESIGDENINIIKANRIREAGGIEGNIKEEEYKLYYTNIKQLLDNPHKKNGIPCSAGINVCHISWEGKMTPCVSFNAFSEDPRELGFKKCWDDLRYWADKVPRLEPCSACVHQLRCPACLSFHYNDTHKFGIPSKRLCWKNNHPEEATAIETRLIEKGIISKEDLMNNG